MLSIRFHRTSCRRSTLAALVVWACGAAAPAAAALHDHLKCYKVKDPTSFSATVNLDPSEPVFAPDSGCTIRVRSRELCFPVEKAVVQSEVDLGVSGAELGNAFLCYKMQCPAPAFPDAVQMSDQFGTRVLSGLRTSRICAPAVVGLPPTTTLPAPTPRSCVDATPPNCDGTCSDFNLACVEDAGACICLYVDVFGPCPMVGHGAPECHGSCNGSQTCIDAGGGACQCATVYE